MADLLVVQAVLVTKLLIRPDLARRAVGERAVKDGGGDGLAVARLSRCKSADPRDSRPGGGAP